MSTITLESIRADQVALTAKIEAFARSMSATEYRVPEVTIDLAAGESYAGIILDDGEPSHHLILLSGEQADLAHEDALAWAKGTGGDLPDRREQALLYANLKPKFQAEAYWSAETHADDSSYAWYQTFSYGFQDCSPKTSQLRAVAVRRLVIE